MSENRDWKRWTLIAAACLAFIVATRWPLVPTRHLYHIDNVNFALALDDFNPALDRPQPPGDPMYVALTRCLRPFTPRAEILFPVSGILGSAAAMVALWWLGNMLFGARAAWTAAFLLALNPIFWLAGVGNYVRVYLALGAATVAGLVWKSRVYRRDRSLTVAAPIESAQESEPRPSGSGSHFARMFVQIGAARVSQRSSFFHGFSGSGSSARRATPVSKSPGGAAAYFCASAAALGFFAGFRPEMGLLLAPLVFLPHVGRRAPLWTWLAAAGALAATTLPWLLITAEHTGGLATLYHLNSEYLARQSRHSSLLYGASVPEGLRMAAASLYWMFLGAAPFAAFVPLAWRHWRDAAAEFRFLALWFVPPFLFFTFVHIHNPDHALDAIPVVCLAGGWVLSRWRWWATVAAFAASAVLFFYPTGSPFWASNYRIALYTMRTAEQVYSRIGTLQNAGPLTVLVRDPYITSREIGYYFPDVPIVDLGEGPPRVTLGNRSRVENGDLLLPAGTVLWLDPVGSAGAFDALRTATGGELGSEGPVHWAKLPPGARFTVGAQRISASQ